MELGGALLVARAMAAVEPAVTGAVVVGTVMAIMSSLLVVVSAVAAAAAAESKECVLAKASCMSRRMVKCGGASFLMVHFGLLPVGVGTCR